MASANPDRDRQARRSGRVQHSASGKGFGDPVRVRRRITPLPPWVLLVDDLPRTRNMKIMRRVLRAVLEDKDPGDLSALANPEAVDALRTKIAAS